MPPNMGGQSGMSMQQYATPTDPPPLRKFYTLQRVNGNGGNGKGDGVAGPHKHTLEESDRVKKNSVIRWQAKADKDDKKKAQVSITLSLCIRFRFPILSICLALMVCYDDPLCQKIEHIRHLDAH